ncbi:hypothetical protein ABL78_3351 [Leptomonas seymouri]|uniref:SET domain-containing protein n=1 Tax=Leptomonas seymouri TaxID=5684 RepID=A0A0N1PDV1_LEPSE|nr:hypothetical protein ABL78_3351 [Leptomonas seymouri]|eukprot:KPI87554.1 hypothetical protein ABL78_3351 [Leptomonas seymouri]
MEELRLKGNSCFAKEPAEALPYYMQAVELYESLRGKDASCTIDELTKSAGNALTCLFRLGKTEQCSALATRVLKHNPIFAKANAMCGRCALADPSLDLSTAGSGTANAIALRFLCRAIYELPALEVSVRENIEEALTRLIRERVTVSSAFMESNEPGLRIVSGKHGCGVEAIRTIPSHAEVASLQTPFSVGGYEEFGGKGCCVECSLSLKNIMTELQESDGDVDHNAREDSDTNQEDAREREDKRSAEGGLRTCPECDMVAYCSEECEVAHSKQHEEFECARMQRLKEMMNGINANEIDAPEQFYEIAYHCITTIAGIRSKREDYDSVSTLTAHADAVLKALHPIGPLIANLFRGEEQPPLLCHVIGVLRCNAIEVADASGLGVGKGLYLGMMCASYYNHSCAPNCAIDAVQRRIITTRTIQVGEELTIAYIPQLYWPTRLRQECLSEGFFFTCGCPRCAEGTKDAFENALCMALPTGRKDATAHYHPIVQVRCTAVRVRNTDDITVKDAEELNDLLTELMKHLFPFHYLCHEVRNCLSFVYAVLADDQQCLSSCLDELLLWECVLPGALPVKEFKISNALRCVQMLGPDAPCAAALYPHLASLALLYEVAYPDNM